jgi:glycine cleavage system H protein
MEIPTEFHFTKDHEWAHRDENGHVIVGISHYAQDALGDIVFVELPSVGDALTAGNPFGVVESVKAVNDVYSPISGTVVGVNTALDDTPELVNESPYEGGWMIRVECAEDALGGLMTKTAYVEFLGA